jgi:CHC2 zinc finger
MISLSLDAHAVKSRADFLAIAGRYTRLRRAGRQYIGLCPFHQERHPSFYVDPARKIFFCFGCGAGGDVFDFVMQISSCDFRRALQIVAGVARASEPRSGEHLGVSEGGEAPSARAAGSSYSPDEHARLVARLDATERHLTAIRAANDAASAALATACEPERLYLSQTG